ncbi:hypothetical protein BV898_13424 [Hypsibius exemplaris]|uniref:Uncharacterized protein n=1 Tax=Hypsibius exemplaris TaxID=2072580 RepID=A0A1W0WAY2_HYPEX|nr:hypothetical protein BV898_13424 [Hypsibius exemplaris]
MEAVPELQALFERLQVQLYGRGGGEGNRTLTENAAGAFTSTGDKCLDFFATVVRSTSVETVLAGFLAAWNEDPEKAVKLLLNLRDIRSGKGEKKVSLVLLYALSCWKPLTYLANLQRFLQVGCYKDLLFVAELAVRGATAENSLQRLAQMSGDQQEPIELKILACQLLNDEAALKASDKASISLCAKWVPTENTHFDRKPLRFSRKITKAMGLKKSEYRKRVSALRAHLTVLELLMCTGKWDEIVFKSLPAKAHRQYRKAFRREENSKKIKSDDRVALAARYAEYLAQLTKGEVTIKSTGTQPHDLVKVYMDHRSMEVDLTIEGQWKDMIAKLAETGNFKHVQAVCDVSGSMSGTPMEVAIALGMVVAELTAEPFHSKLITFSANPQLHTIVGDNLRDRINNIERMQWDMNTNLLKVFELLLSEAEKNPQAEMVEKLFIFSDMQFDEARGSGGHPWTTTYETICQMFGKTKYAVPKIIFWNLRATHKSFPVQKDEIGTALISGFSAQMMKAFLSDETVEFGPLTIMNDALDKYEITEIPKEERFPLTSEQAGVSSFSLIGTIVEDFMVAKKVSKRKRREIAVGEDGDNSDEDATSESE